MRFVTDRETFAAERRGILDRADLRIAEAVKAGIGLWPAPHWDDEIIQAALDVARLTFTMESGLTEHPNLEEVLGDFGNDLQNNLDRTTEPDEGTVDRLTRWISTASVNVGTYAAAIAEEDEVTITWITMEDEAVRPAHEDAHGQTVPIGTSFTVGGVPMRFPGDPTAPIELWINCRCVIAPELPNVLALSNEGDTMTADAAVEEELDDTEFPSDEMDEFDLEPVPWHGVLAPEGKLSGDNRIFKPDTLRWRDLPLPLSYQRQTAEGHDGSVVVGRIDDIWREDGLIKAQGVFDNSEEADEAVHQLAEQMIRGVSVDVDDATMTVMGRDGDEVVEASEDPEQVKVAQFTDGRICGSTMCAIPAFAEAFIAIGPWEDEGTGEVEMIESGEEGEEDFTKNLTAFVSDKPWSDFTQADYTPQQWKTACCLHRSQELEPKSNHGLPIKEPGGALNKNGVHAAAARFNQVSAPAEAKAAAKSCLRGAYRQIGEQAPDVLKASGEEFGRGPGWLTHPVDTRRLHRYWTSPGQPGFAKIRWGQPGDFNRCRRQLGKYITPGFLSQVCAQWHHDAIGIWPGQHAAQEKRGIRRIAANADPSVNLVSMVASADADWFADPQLLAPSPVVVTEQGRVFGHLATWDTCHIGFGDVCVTAPHSVADYAYFKTGAVLTSRGEIPVGQITMDTGHADLHYGARKAASHYDNTGSVVADVNVGEDAHGIWVAGRVREGVTDEQVAGLRAAALSGDWRRIGGAMELVAALAVNTPGFPIPRTALAASGARQTALVAASLVPQPVDLNTLVRQAMDEYEKERERHRRAKELRDKIRKNRQYALVSAIEGSE